VDDFAIVSFIPDVAVPIIVLPQLAAPPKDAVDAARGVALPALQKFGHGFPPDFHQEMDMVGHHGPRQHAVILTVKVKPVFLDHVCGARVAQLAVAEATVEICFNLRATLEFVFDVQQSSPFVPVADGHGVVEAVVEHLDDARRVEVRKVAA
jgi:hypothetical protein